MKRDMDLARQILLELEKHPEPNGWLDIEIHGHTDAEISYHIKLLAQAELIEAQDVSTIGPDGFNWKATSLTWEGHEFLEAARDNNRWEKAKKLISEKGGGLIYEALKQLLVQGTKTAIGL